LMPTGSVGSPSPSSSTTEAFHPSPSGSDRIQYLRPLS
jgi:hypothetical protein